MNELTIKERNVMGVGDLTKELIRARVSENTLWAYCCPLLELDGGIRDAGNDFQRDLYRVR